ncbi:MAG: DUF3329 domain-containing protein [Muribaculaceae bacterium]|nr:DUF3329 domain-containing protein [Muribaculaceae bacterium]
MKKIIYRLFFAVIPALPVWIILGNLWVGVFVAFLVYITIHFYQFIIYSTTMATYEYFSQHFVDAETGKKIDTEKLRQIVDTDPVYREKLKKVIRRFI